ncbi:641_t:CDS:2, partial [Dentiscutata heterogama]
SSIQSKEDEISLNEVKLAIKSITPKQTVYQIRTSSLISTKKRKRKDDPEFYEEIEDLESISINLFQASKVDFDKPAHIPEPNININDILSILIW